MIRKTPTIKVEPSPKNNGEWIAWTQYKVGKPYIYVYVTGKSKEDAREKAHEALQYYRRRRNFGG